MRLNHSKDRNRLSFFPSTFEVILCTTLLANLAFILLQTFVSIFFHQMGSGKKGCYTTYTSSLEHLSPGLGQGDRPLEHLPPGRKKHICPLARRPHTSLSQGDFPGNSSVGFPQGTFLLDRPVFPKGISQGIPHSSVTHPPQHPQLLVGIEIKFGRNTNLLHIDPPIDSLTH